MQQLDAMRVQLERQVSHWEAAAEGLRYPDDFAAPGAWKALEQYLDSAVRASLEASTERLRREAAGLRAQLRSATTPAELASVGQRLLRLRRLYTKVETVVDFYGDAVNTRTSARIAGHLRALDRIAEQSMAAALRPLGRPVPPALTYIDAGIGASILRAGIRLWDGGLSPAAAIKVTRHNLFRPTSLIHETGHQVAHLLAWNTELVPHILRSLDAQPAVAQAWASWVSEVTADAFAFAHCGYASVAALHDVVASEPETVMRLIPGDPHPVAWVRVLLGVEMCTRAYGSGPWDALGAAWRETHPLEAAPPGIARLLAASIPYLGTVAELMLNKPLAAFAGKTLRGIVDPARVSPTALAALATRGGGSLFLSPHWAESEPIRIMALSGWRVATDPANTVPHTRDFASFTRVLGTRPAISTAA